MTIERKLELKDICGYIPYLVCVKVRNTRNTKNSGKIKRLLGTNAYNHGFWVEDEHVLKIDEFNVILRPLSDLYRTITHNGKEIIPIIECAGMIRIADWKLGKNLAYTKSEYGEFVFEYHENSFNLSIGEDAKWTHSQFILFDYLNSLFIDYRGLIDAKLAIDCNMISNNPYK